MKFAALLDMPLRTVIESGKLLPGVTNEPVVHEIVASDPVKGVVRISCTFFEIPIGSLLAKADANGDAIFVAITGE